MSHRRGKACVLLVAVLGLGCGLACDRKPPDRELILVEKTIRAQLDEPRERAYCDCSRWSGERTIWCRLVAGNDEVARLIEAFSLRPYDAVNGRYLSASPEPDHMEWRADNCIVRSDSAAVAMESIELVYGATDAWCEIHFTLLKAGQPGSAQSRP